MAPQPPPLPGQCRPARPVLGCSHVGSHAASAAQPHPSFAPRRVQQFVDILRHARQVRAAGAVPVIMGDLNTMANGVARLSPHYCCDQLRWRTLGVSEACWWNKHIFGVEGEQHAGSEAAW
jgi:hypothetical protein